MVNDNTNIIYKFFTLYHLRLTTAKNEKVGSLNVPDMWFIGKKQLVYQYPIILLKLQFLWVCEIWGHFMKNWYFVNNCLLKFESKSYFAHIIVIIYCTPHFVST